MKEYETCQGRGRVGVRKFSLINMAQTVKIEHYLKKMGEKEIIQACSLILNIDSLYFYSLRTKTILNLVLPSDDFEAGTLT